MSREFSTLNLVQHMHRLVRPSSPRLEVLDMGRWVVASYRFHARGRSSRVPMTRDSVAASRFRGAKVERVEMFGTKEQALAAVDVQG